MELPVVGIRGAAMESVSSSLLRSTTASVTSILKRFTAQIRLSEQRYSHAESAKANIERVTTS